MFSLCLCVQLYFYRYRYVETHTGAHTHMPFELSQKNTLDVCALQIYFFFLTLKYPPSFYCPSECGDQK